MRVALKIIFILAVFAAPSIAGLRADAAENGAVKLDADLISFEESTGIATAEGNVRMNDGEFHATAPYLEYDNLTQRVTAFSSPSEKVVVFTEGKRLAGDRLDYNLETRRGKMASPAGKVDVFHVRGKEIDVMPSSETPSRRRRVSSGDVGAEDDELAAIWRGATLTTCDESHPHYRLEARTVTIYPGEKMVLHWPKAYLGNVLVMVSPFDITLSLKGRRANQQIFPRLGYDSDKGVGLGMAGSFNWDRGSLALDFIGWSEGVFEMDALATHQITANLSAYAGLRRAYDKDMDDTDWRPRWGVGYGWNGWNVSAGWTRRELLSVEKRAGEVSRYILERNPEINVSSPWFRDPAVEGNFRVFGVWGNYRDVRWGTSQSYDRTGLGVQVVGEPGAKRNFTPFYNATYVHYMYDDDLYDSQDVVDARVGLLWSAGKFDFKTAYLRQWVWGRSPLAWDAYGEREELYQEIGLTIPMKSPEYSWTLGARAAYDIMAEELAEMVYKVAYNHHCLLWEVVYRDDIRGDDDWMGLSLSIRDLPHGGFRLFGDSDNDLSDPFSH
jgi:LPS-assembly protein